ncbi:PREDICTED: uncharacterized protein LOC108568307 [Nicrophorus vespilloides]|uniref:Uncharacterized protein LOC108568307 n=1 Tax=Nicrophorus vespilloides TaxID=110193 RepID=A0ABM1ND97_NICVS|nr:PREDICTED: uncharacterized protein LOC108568307 [Nicrophorus vespilloides]
MTEDTVDAPILLVPSKPPKKMPSIEALNSEMPGRIYHKERGKRVLKSFLNRLRLKRCASATISQPDPTYKVAYLGNVVTGWAKGEGCVEKPLATLWRNYTQSSRPDVRMQLSVSGGGLKATTRDHGLTEYWAHRLTTCAAPSQFPRLFCWVYRHEGRRLRHELRCHAVLCPSASVARQIEAKLKESLALALTEFRRDKISKQNARLSLVNSVYENPTIPRRKILLSTGSTNYRPPLERSKSAPKLTMIEENLEEDEEIFEGRPRNPKILKHCDSVGAILEKRNSLRNMLNSTKTIFPIDESEADEKMFEYSMDDRSELILGKLVEDTFASDLLESCNMGNWLRNYEKPDDEGSLSSGCESASTVTSDNDQPGFTVILEELDEESENKKAELDFKVGGCVLSRVKSFEKTGKYCTLNNNLLEPDEVSLIPVGESHPDFSSLKVFKKRCSLTDRPFDEEEGSEEENGSACSDESGYDEVIDCASSVANIVLV